MLLPNHPEYVSCPCGYNAVNYDAKSLTTIFLLLPRPFLLSPSPSLSGTLWTRSRLARAYLSNMAESPCTLKHRVQQEYNSLLVNALSHIFKSNLSLNNFKWLLTKLELSCVQNIMPRSRKRLWNRYPILNQELPNRSRPRWAAHTRIGNVSEYPPPLPGLIVKFNKQQLSDFLTQNLPILNPYLPPKFENYIRPRYSHSSRENATPSSGTSLLASFKGVLPPPPPRRVDVVLPWSSSRLQRSHPNRYLWARRFAICVVFWRKYNRLFRCAYRQ